MKRLFYLATVALLLGASFISTTYSRTNTTGVFNVAGSYGNEIVTEEGEEEEDENEHEEERTALY